VKHLAHGEDPYQPCKDGNAVDDESGTAVVFDLTSLPDHPAGTMTIGCAQYRLMYGRKRCWVPGDHVHEVPRPLPVAAPESDPDTLTA
jgi:hypothetical protein